MKADAKRWCLFVVGLARLMEMRLPEGVNIECDCVANASHRGKKTTKNNMTRWQHDNSNKLIITLSVTKGRRSGANKNTYSVHSAYTRCPLKLAHTIWTYIYIFSLTTDWLNNKITQQFSPLNLFSPSWFFPRFWRPAITLYIYTLIALILDT